MAEQMMSEVIARAIAEATRVVLQMMAEAQAQRTQKATGPKLGGPTLKQPTFDWEVPGKYMELKPFKLEACNMLDGLFGMLATKYKPQYNDTIKSLQFRKLYQLDDDNVDEYMGRLHVVAVECNYREVYIQLKEQFIHGLNDRCILEEIIKELTATNDDEQITSEGV